MLACCCTEVGTAGLSSIPAIAELERVAMRTDPISAVPNEAPRFVAVFCSPADLGTAVVRDRRHGNRSEL